MPAEVDDLAMITTQYLGGMDRNVLASNSMPVYFPRRMHQDIPNAFIQIRERILPAISSLNSYTKETHAGSLRGVACLSCGDRDTYWLANSQISGSAGVFGAEYRYSCESTMVAVCNANRKNCVKKGRNVTAGVEDASQLGDEDHRLACIKCEKLDIELGPEAKMKLCGGCRITVYCSAECQKSDWARHKHECRK